MNLVKLVAHHENPEAAVNSFLKDKVIAIGWSRIGDLTDMSREDIKSALKREYTRFRTIDPFKAADEILDFRDGIEVGDIVFLMRKNNLVGLVGEVVGNYAYNKKNATGRRTGLDYANQKSVRWWSAPFRNFGRDELKSLGLSDLLKLRATIHIKYEPEILDMLPRHRVAPELANSLRVRLFERLEKSGDGVGRERNASWSREEVILALDLWTRIRKMPEEDNQDVVRIAHIIDRTPDAVVYKVGNLRYLSTGGKRGFRNVSQTDREVWKEFQGKDELLRREARRIIAGASLAPDDEIAEEQEAARGQGFMGSMKDRKRIEKIAMRRAIAHFERKGYAVRDMHANHPYDLRCRKGKRQLYVEVKGTTTMGRTVLLTANEAGFARRNSGGIALFIVHSIKLSKKDAMTNGTPVLLNPWDIGRGILKPVSFVYEW